MPNKESKAMRCEFCGEQIKSVKAFDLVEHVATCGLTLNADGSIALHPSTGQPIPITEDQ